MARKLKTKYAFYFDLGKMDYTTIITHIEIRCGFNVNMNFVLSFFFLMIL